MSQTNSKLYKQYKLLADRADKRLLRLERLAEKQPDMYKGVLSYAYAKAQKSIAYWDGKESDKPRFARKTPKTDAEMAEKIKDIEAFLNMQTSTKGGIDKTYKKRAEKLNKTFGTDFSWQDWARFGVRGYWEHKDGDFRYNNLIKVAKVQKQKEDAIKAYNKFKKATRTGIGSVKPIKYHVSVNGDNLLEELKNELGIENLLSSDMNLINKTIDTIFEPNKGIVMQHIENKLGQAGLSYDTMFK